MSSRRKPFKRTTLLCVFFAAVLAGLALVRFVKIDVQYAIVGVFALCTIASFSKKNVLTLYLVVLTGCSLGLYRGAQFMNSLQPYSELAGKKVTVQVTADTSAYYNASKQFEFEGTHVKIMDPYEKNLPGKMVISGFGENSILRGDVVQATGKLHTRRGGKQAGISFGHIKVVSRSSSVTEVVRRKFMAGLATALPEPSDQFAAGLLVGQKSDLPADVTDTLRIVGLSHIIAVSGYNLTILAEFARKKLGKKSKFRSTTVSIVLVLLFILFTGSSASIARAAFVSIISIVAAYYGRSFKPLVLILLTAGWTAFANPINIWSDLGWYLSFLAFFGVLVVAPAVTKRMYGNKKPHGIAKLVIESFSAQVMTLPIIMYIFGTVSVVSLLANVLVVPFVPLAMLLGLFAGMAGAFMPLIAGVIAWPARILLDFMLDVSSLVARLPYATVERTMSAVQLVVMYSIVIALVVVMHKKSAKSGIITE